jgi:hypothetical protein
MEKLPDNPSIRIESQIRGSQGRWDGRIAYTQHTLIDRTTAACIIDASMTPLIVSVCLALQFGQP